MKRSAYRSHTGSQGDSFEEQDVDKLVFTGEDLSPLDDTLLEPVSFGLSAPVTSISPLTSLPAPLPASSQNIQSPSVSAGPNLILQPFLRCWNLFNRQFLGYSTSGSSSTHPRRTFSSRHSWHIHKQLLLLWHQLHPILCQ